MTTTEPTTPDEGDKGDGPASNETSGQFPADDVRGGPAPDTDPDDKGDGPASNETSGQFPADDVNDAPSSYTTVGPADHEPATVDAPDPPDDEGDKG